MILQIAVALIFFVNKVLVLVGQKSGWLVGAFAAFLAVLYFYGIGLYIYTALELGLIVLMTYGYFKKEKKNQAVETTIRFLTVVVMTAIAFFAFSGRLTIVELFSTSGLLWGTYLMTHDRLNLGWAVCAVAHVFAGYLGYNKGQTIFADFQVASAIVSVVGATKK